MRNTKYQFVFEGNFILDAVVSDSKKSSYWMRRHAVGHCRHEIWAAGTAIEAVSRTKRQEARFARMVL
jgi:hypothetical protein